jgi:predicted ferric reductase
MNRGTRSLLRALSIWVFLAAAILIPLIAAGFSPLLKWREPVYIAAGFAGIVAMVFMLVQPLLIGGALPGFSGNSGRRVHFMVGCCLVLAVVVHVAGLWITSPPDVIDALLFRSPTPFSAWGVIAMGCVFAAGVLAVSRRRMKLQQRVWRRWHAVLAAAAVLGGVVHAFLIEGAMETISKAGLCALVVIATGMVVADRLRRRS